jgi:hypothetical protein
MPLLTAAFYARDIQMIMRHEVNRGSSCVTVAPACPVSDALAQTQQQCNKDADNENLKANKAEKSAYAYCCS